MALSPVPDLTSPGRPARLAAAIAVLMALVQVVRGHANLGVTLGDTDDALRLVMVRGLIEGRGWFDATVHRLQPPDGVDMHWSRLVDGGLAALDRLFALFVAPETAEIWMRLVWPLLFLFPFALGAVLTARRLGGSVAVLAAAIFIACFPVLIQFAVGRIDHHNVQMALAMLMLAGAANPETRWGPWLAGISTGLLLAVGLEGLIFAAIAGGAIALRFAANADFAPVARRYAMALGVTTGAAFLVQTPPRLWSATACDVLSVNLVAGIAAACIGLFAARFARRPAARILAIVVAGIAAACVYVALDPACLRGPYAYMNPDLRPIWLDHVSEVQTWPDLLRTRPALAAMLAAPIVMALAASMALLRRPDIWRDPAWLTLFAIFMASVLSGFYMIRMLSYSAAFAAIVLAVAFARFLPTRLAKSFIAVALAAFLISPAIVTPLAARLGTVWQENGQAETSSPDVCRASASYDVLKMLPPGLFLADIDAGPHLLAHTPHSALAAPYHRMNRGIAAAHDIWSAPPREAESKLRADGIAYVMLCPKRGKLPIRFDEASLRARLEAGDMPDYLESVPGGDVFKVWRVR